MLVLSTLSLVLILRLQPVQAAILGEVEPDVPSSVTSNTPTTSGFTVNWTDNSDNETGFKVYISTMPTSGLPTPCDATVTYALYATTATDATSQVVTGQSSNQYCAKVVATNSSGDSTAAYAASPLYTAVTSYIPSDNLVQVSPYNNSAVSGTANWGCSTGCSNGGYMEFATIGNRYRIRENGTISQVRIYAANTTSLTGFYIKIWRLNQDGINYDLVGTSNNIASSIVGNAVTTISLSTPITGVEEGDYYGYRIEDSTNASNFFAGTGVSGVSSYYLTNSTPEVTQYNWAEQAANTGSVLPIQLYMQAPQVAFIGDSLIAGLPTNLGFLATLVSPNSSDFTKSIGYQFSTLTGYTYQNLGISGQSTAQISARFSNDVIPLNPRIVVIEGGINDINHSGADMTNPSSVAPFKAIFQASWTSMLDAAQASPDIKRIIVLKMLPVTSDSNPTMRVRDDWNNSLVTLAANYSKAVVADASSYVGQFRPGGDLGNLWDIQPAYDTPLNAGLHYNPAGYGRIAQALVNATYIPTTITTQDTSNITAISATGNGNITATNGANATTQGFVYTTDSSAGHDCSSLGTTLTSYNSGSYITGSYTTSINGLNPNTYYCNQAYATNSFGIGYGSYVSFQTLPITYTLIYSAGANGSIVGTSPQTVNSGASGTEVTATPASGYHFVSWSDNVLTAARTDINITTDITVTATFAATTTSSSKKKTKTETTPAETTPESTTIDTVPTTEEIVTKITNTIHDYNVSEPTASFTKPSDNITGSTVTFDASGSTSNKGITKYEWDFGDSQTSNDVKTNHKYKSPGRYAVTLTVTDRAGNKNVTTQTVDIEPIAPTITNIIAKGTALWIEGKADPNTTIYFTIHSNPFEGQGLANKDGYWTYYLDNASEILGAGDHTIMALSAVKLSDNTELKGAKSKTSDFKMSVDDGKLKVETQKTRIWQIVSIVSILIIILLAALLVLRRKRALRKY